MKLYSKETSFIVGLLKIGPYSLGTSVCIYSIDIVSLKSAQEIFSDDVSSIWRQYNFHPMFYVILVNDLKKYIYLILIILQHMFVGLCTH